MNIRETRSTRHPWLDRFGWFTAAATFLLLGLGGLVTSHEAGLAVPDWPTTYGYNMFLFPLHLWQGNIFYEQIDSPAAPRPRYRHHRAEITGRSGASLS